MNKSIVERFVSSVLENRSVGITARVKSAWVQSPSYNFNQEESAKEARSLMAILLAGHLAERYGWRLILDDERGVQQVFFFSPEKERIKAYLMVPIWAKEADNYDGPPIVESYETLATAEISLDLGMANKRFVYCENIAKTRRVFAAEVESIFDFFADEVKAWFSDKSE